MVVLYLDHRAFACHLETALRGQVLRVLIDGDDVWGMIKEVFVKAQIACHIIVRSHILQIAHMLGDDRASVLDQAERVLLFRAERQRHG